ncbi:InlB B-repeat-containing protein [Rudaea sp.]|uniref:InlB B-repeat-containing protein n=1 Tax=Rudaea sp. TaxID=2136325 RepID=UPI002ED18071
MRKLLAICAAWGMFFAPSTWAATYTFASGNYDSGQITVGSNPYTTAMKTTGSFTVGPLPANQSTQSDAIGSLQTWNVNDGVITHTPANSIPTLFSVSTDASGTITGFTLNVTTSPVTAGQPAYVAFISMAANGYRNITVQYDSSCSATATDPPSGKTFCNSLIYTGGDTVATAAALAGSFSTGGTAPTTYTVTPSAGTGGAISPSTPQTVNSGATATFTVTPTSGYQLASVSGTCGGALSGNTYITNAVTANCTVIAAFSATPTTTFTVTPSAGAGGTISPSTPQTVNSGATATFTVTPTSGYQIAGVGGTCGGTLSGNAYTTNAITANCTVNAAFSVALAPAPAASAPTLGQWGLTLLLLGICAAAVRHGRRAR